MVFLSPHDRGLATGGFGYSGHTGVEGDPEEVAPRLRPEEGEHPGLEPEVVQDEEVLRELEDGLDGEEDDFDVMDVHVLDDARDREDAPDELEQRRKPEAREVEQGRRGAGEEHPVRPPFEEEEFRRDVEDLPREGEVVEDEVEDLRREQAPLPPRLCAPREQTEQAHRVERWRQPLPVSEVRVVQRQDLLLRDPLQHPPRGFCRTPRVPTLVAQVDHRRRPRHTPVRPVPQGRPQTVAGSRVRSEVEDEEPEQTSPPHVDHRP